MIHGQQNVYQLYTEESAIVCADMEGSDFPVIMPDWDKTSKVLSTRGLCIKLNAYSPLVPDKGIYGYNLSFLRPLYLWLPDVLISERIR
jgi:hypothetical protein